MGQVVPTVVGHQGVLFESKQPLIKGLQTGDT
jgi:hypothetical protein